MAATRRTGGEPWNLMTSYFPRTETVVLDAMALYKDEFARTPGAAAGHGMVTRTADVVIEAFDRVVQLPSALPEPLRETVYQWIALMPGFKVATAAQMVGELRYLCAEKVEKGLL